MRRRQRRAAIRRAPLPAELVYREINEARCAASSALMERMPATRNELFCALDRLRREDHVEAASLGRAALWCINSAAAEAALAELAEALKSLLRRRSRFTTPKEILHSRRGQRNAEALLTLHDATSKPGSHLAHRRLDDKSLREADKKEPQPHLHDPMPAATTPFKHQTSGAPGSATACPLNLLFQQKMMHPLKSTKRLVPTALW
jgi:hypothetical protein